MIILGSIFNLNKIGFPNTGKPTSEMLKQVQNDKLFFLKPPLFIAIEL